MPEMGWGCNELVKFNQETFPALQKSLIVVDGDFNSGDQLKYNVLKLPGGSSPEAIIYTFLKSLDPDHELLNNSSGINKRSLEEYGPFSSEYNDYTPNRKKYKKWFQNNMSHLMSLRVISYWKESYDDAINSFIKEFQEKLSSIRAMRDQ